MGCRCGDITTLEGKKTKLENVKTKSSSFTQNISSCKTELGYLVNDSWSAAESTTLKADCQALPTMTDKLEESHNTLIAEIDSALTDIESDLEELRTEDNEHHKSLEQQNISQN